MMTVRERTIGKGREYHFASRGGLACHLAEEVATLLKQAITTKNTASLVVSGGKTPVMLFQQLRTLELAWSQVWVTLTDEQWIDVTSPESNELLVQETLLKNVAGAANFVPLKNASATPELGQSQCEQALTTILKPFDVVIVGMGDDGHTASLFPNSPELAAGLDKCNNKQCLAVNPIHAPHPRISLTLPALLNTYRLILLITGDSKWAIYQIACSDGSDAAIQTMPIRALLHQTDVPLDVYWAR